MSLVAPLGFVVWRERVTLWKTSDSPETLSMGRRIRLVSVPGVRSGPDPGVYQTGRYACIYIFSYL